jgi:hypothetical protein
VHDTRATKSAMSAKPTAPGKAGRRSGDASRRHYQHRKNAFHDRRSSCRLAPPLVLI